MSLVQKHNWRPSASVENIKARAKLYRQIRDFFSRHNVLEVETPVLDSFGVSDIHIESITATYNCNQKLYLQTSPEYAMKRLLSAGLGSIYQISKAFRNDECGKFHNPEFSMLEWYRTGFSHHDLMDEMDLLLQATLNSNPATRISYLDLFQQHFNLNPHSCELEMCLKALGDQNIELSLDAANIDKDTALQLLLSHVIEPKLGFDAPCFIYDYPKTQSSLAKVESDKALRFEVYINGVELANGFYELTDADEQQARFEKDQIYRQKNNLPEALIDHRFIAALEHGLPECSGVALGLDRLLMIKTGAKSIKEVISFALPNPLN